VPHCRGQCDTSKTGAGRAAERVGTKTLDPRDSAYATVPAYDINGLVTKLTDAASGETEYAYDLVERLTKLTDPLDHATTYAYDVEGNLTKRTDPLSNAAEFSYATNESARNVELLTKSVNDRGVATIAYQYDDMRRLSRVYQDLGGGSTKTYADMRYNVDGEVTRVAHGAANDTCYTYEANTGPPDQGRPRLPRRQ